MLPEVPMVEVREVLRLRRKGYGLRRTSELLGMNRKTVRRYLAVAEMVGSRPESSEITDSLVTEVLVALQPGRLAPAGLGGLGGPAPSPEAVGGRGLAPDQDPGAVAAAQGGGAVPHPAPVLRVGTGLWDSPGDRPGGRRGTRAGTASRLRADGAAAPSRDSSTAGQGAGADFGGEPPHFLLAHLWGASGGGHRGV